LPFEKKKKKEKEKRKEQVDKTKTKKNTKKVFWWEDSKEQTLFRPLEETACT